MEIAGTNFKVKAVGLKLNLELNLSNEKNLHELYVKKNRQFKTIIMLEIEYVPILFSINEENRSINKIE